MTRDADFERFAADATTGMILALRKMGGATFTESDRRAMGPWDTGRGDRGSS